MTFTYESGKKPLSFLFTHPVQKAIGQIPCFFSFLPANIKDKSELPTIQHLCVPSHGLF